MEIELDWYDKYGIEVVESVRAYEEYALPNGGIQRITPKTVAFVGAKGNEMVEDLQNIIKNEMVKLKGILTYFEQLIFVNDLALIFYHDIPSIVPFGVVASRIEGTSIASGVSFLAQREMFADKIPLRTLPQKIHLIELIKLSVKKDFKKQILDNSVKKTVENLPNGKKIIMQSRKPWEITFSQICPTCEQDSPDSNHSAVNFRTRLAFGVIDKGAIRVEDGGSVNYGY